MPYRKRVTADSSNIAKSHYDSANQTLKITFHSGGVYEYADVPPSIPLAMSKAESAGKFFYQHIKGKFDYTHISG